MIEFTWELIKIPVAVLVTDTMMWLNWALTDGTINSYEWKILLNRVIKFGTAGVMLVLAGLSWEQAAAFSGLGVFADSWIKSLTPPKTSDSNMTTL